MYSKIDATPVDSSPAQRLHSRFAALGCTPEDAAAAVKASGNHAGRAAAVLRARFGEENAAARAPRAETPPSGRQLFLRTAAEPDEIRNEVLQIRQGAVHSDDDSGGDYSDYDDEEGDEGEWDTGVNGGSPEWRKSATSTIGDGASDDDGYAMVAKQQSERHRHRRPRSGSVWAVFPRATGDGCSACLGWLLSSAVSEKRRLVLHGCCALLQALALAALMLHKSDDDSDTTSASVTGEVVTAMDDMGVLATDSSSSGTTDSGGAEGAQQPLLATVAWTLVVSCGVKQLLAYLVDVGRQHEGLVTLLHVQYAQRDGGGTPAAATLCSGILVALMPMVMTCYRHLGFGMFLWLQFGSGGSDMHHHHYHHHHFHRHHSADDDGGTMEETVTLREVFVKRGLAPPQLLWCGFIVCSVLESAMACALHLLPKDTDAHGKDDDAVMAPKLEEVRAANEARSGGSGSNRLCGFSFSAAHRSQRRARGGQGRPQLTRPQHTSPPPRSRPTTERVSTSSGSHPRPPNTAPVGYLFGGGSGSRNDSVV